MPNINDVVRLSGVSKSTVSRVINNYPHIAPEKRERVIKVMKEIGYTPNVSAQKLRGLAGKIIGVIVPRIVNPFFSYLVESIEKEGYRRGYQTVIFQSNEDSKREVDFLNLLKRKQVDGVIMTAYENDWDTIKKYLKFGPIVLCNEYLPEPFVPIVKVDQFTASYEGVKHLVQQGYRKIAYCTGGLFNDSGKYKDRNHGYEKALAEADIEINPSWLFIKRHTIEDGRKVLHQIYNMQDRPDAIFTGSDEVAAGIIMEARKVGLRIPEELAVIGFDDQPLAEMLMPELTTIKQPVSDIGYQAMDLIINRLEGNEVEVEDKIYTLPFKLVIRKST
ncbi:LacI family DNA-binding transcriptional regulator [Paenibacillus camelliae]|uniref:LacI family DNA-binding transcriptional regulator n=1 Tax=Paenibacillus camelliae TaxID=512410 RepID=UPI0020408060|nr:LacI family DNA-binding transcriptional regulator [Paenibacillus camelliae]MCM3635572.1 LacI family transcriptional regulator [Paenibacillus camelliae]